MSNKAQMMFSRRTIYIQSCCFCPDSIPHTVIAFQTCRHRVQAPKCESELNLGAVQAVLDYVAVGSQYTISGRSSCIALFLSCRKLLFGSPLCIEITVSLRRRSVLPVDGRGPGGVGGSLAAGLL